MPLIRPDAFLQAHRNRKATFECLKSFRRFHPESFIYLVSDGGDDLSDIARLFRCSYDRFEAMGRPPWSAEQAREWLRRIVVAARQGTAEYLMHLEDDVLLRGPIIRANDHFAIAGPYHGGARFGERLVDYLSDLHAKRFSAHYGGCGGTLLHRTTFLKCAEAFDFGRFAFLAELDGRIRETDGFLTLLFLLAGYEYESLEDVYCEATGGYPGWESNGRPIVHQFKRFYGQPLDLDDLKLLRGAECAR
jgi:hypothetical protein